jgi:hypothetical protein
VTRALKRLTAPNLSLAVGPVIHPTFLKVTVAVTMVIAALTAGSPESHVYRDHQAADVAAQLAVDQARALPPVVIPPGSPLWGVGDPTAPLWPATPVRLQIPAIGVDSGLIPLALAADGTLETPPTGVSAGWYTGAATPGEMGPAVVAGHLDWNGPGVFYKLRSLAPGDQVSVTRDDASVAIFTVTEVVLYAKDAFPTDRVYGGLDYAGLRLITCGGTFDKASGHYEDNIVAYAFLSNSVVPGRVVTPPPTPGVAPLRLAHFVPSIFIERPAP